MHELGPGDEAEVRLSEQRSLLATLPEHLLRGPRSLAPSASQARRPLRSACCGASHREPRSDPRGRARRSAPGLNAITGETGAGKTILAQAIGLLLGATGDAALVGPDGDEAYVEAELDLPEGCSTTTGSRRSPSCARRTRTALVLARRVFADGRTRAYAWGRSAAREDVAAAAERLDRDVRPVRAAPARAAGVPARRARRVRRRRAAAPPGGAARAPGASSPRRAGATRSSRTAPRAEARLAELRALVEDTEGLEPDAEERLRGERERLRHVTELARGRRGGRRGARARGGRRRRGPRRARRAGGRAARAARARARAGRRRAPRRRASPARDGIRAARVPRLARGRAGPARAGRGRARPDRRREAALPLRDLRGAAGARGGGAGRARRRSTTARDPARGRRRSARRRRRSASTALAAELRGAAASRGRAVRGRQSRPSSAAIGLGEGEFRVELGERRAGPDGRRRGRVPRSGRTRACRSRRSPRPRRAASCRGSRSRSRPSAAARRSSSTRSTPASAARPRTPSARRSGASPSARR